MMKERLIIWVILLLYSGLLMAQSADESKGIFSSAIMIDVSYELEQLGFDKSNDRLFIVTDQTLDSADFESLELINYSLIDFDEVDDLIIQEHPSYLIVITTFLQQDSCIIYQCNLYHTGEGRITMRNTFGEQICIVDSTRMETWQLWDMVH